MNPRRALAGMIAFGCAAAAFGADGAKAAKRHPASPKPPAEVILENKRRVALQSFEIFMPAEGSTAERLVARLAKPLAGGENASLPLDNAKGCAFEARWKFEDAEDRGAVDLCRDAHIVMVD